MGYESRVFIIERSECCGGKFVYGDEIARFELCKMGNEVVNYKYFTDVFKTPIDFDLHDIGEDPNCEEYREEDYRTDQYGEHCKYASIDSVLEWLESSETVNVEKYRRAVLLRDFLKMLKDRSSDFGNIVVVHYGH